MTDEQEASAEILATRKAMLNGGWRYAIEGKPGVYVPSKPNPPSYWIVTREQLLQRFGGI